MRCIFVLFLLGVARDADACSCMESGPPCQSFFQVQAVFAGTVRSVTATPRVPQVMENVRVEFEDAIPFRGVEGTIQTVFTSVPDIGSCGYAFKPGERYVVYAYRSKPGEPLRTGICSRTRPIAEAAEDLQFFKSLSSTTGSPRVYGSVTHSEPGTPTREGRNYGPVPNVRLTLQSDTASYQAVSDASGRYELTNVPPATYQLSIEPAPELISYGDLKRPITLSDRHSCAERNFVMHYDGRVRGSIRNATGGPAAGVLVSHKTSASGAVFGPTYHPGTPDGLRGTIVEIRGGERHDLTPMTLPPPLRAHRLTGIVKFEDGTPAAGATVLLGDAVKKWMDLAEPVDTDASGAFSFIVHEGLSYIVTAFYRPPNAGRIRPIPTDVGPFEVTKVPAPLEIVVARTPLARTP